MKIPLNFSNFSLGGWWGQPISLFQKLVDETQMAAPRECTDAFITIKKMFLGGLRGLQYSVYLLFIQSTFADLLKNSILVLTSQNQ